MIISINMEKKLDKNSTSTNDKNSQKTRISRTLPQRDTGHL